MGMNELIDLQHELMSKVPHDLKPEVVPKMWVGVKIIDTLLRYLGSTGHKPWRPNPLPIGKQNELMEELEKSVAILGFLQSIDSGSVMDAHNIVAEMTDGSELRQRQLVSALGVIEESVEHLNALANKENDPDNVLEELVDVLFFWLEQLIMSGYSWEMVENQYYKKWHTNMERYRRAQNNDYDWDKRSEGKL